MEQTSKPEHVLLAEEWEIDSAIDRTKLMESLYRIPILHSKYLTRLQGYKVQLRKKYRKYEEKKLLKTRYYSGELSEDELKLHGWKQYLFKRPLKSELDTILNGDPDLQTIKEQMEYLNILIESSESIMKNIQSRNFITRDIIELMKFEAGA